VYARAALAISAVLLSPEGSVVIRHGAVVEKIAAPALTCRHEPS